MLSEFLTYRERSLAIYKTMLEYLSSKEAKENYKVLGKWLGFITIYTLTFSFLIADFSVKTFTTVKEKIKEKSLDKPE